MSAGAGAGAGAGADAGTPVGACHVGIDGQRYVPADGDSPVGGQDTIMPADKAGVLTKKRSRFTDEDPTNKPEDKRQHTGSRVVVHVLPQPAQSPARRTAQNLLPGAVVRIILMFAGCIDNGVAGMLSRSYTCMVRNDSAACMRIFAKLFAHIPSTIYHAPLLEDISSDNATKCISSIVGMVIAGNIPNIYAIGFIIKHGGMHTDFAVRLCMTYLTTAIANVTELPDILFDTLQLLFAKTDMGDAAKRLMLMQLQKSNALGCIAPKHKAVMASLISECNSVIESPFDKWMFNPDTPVSATLGIDSSAFSMSQIVDLIRAGVPMSNVANLIKFRQDKFLTSMKHIINLAFAIIRIHGMAGIRTLETISAPIYYALFYPGLAVKANKKLGITAFSTAVGARFVRAMVNLMCADPGVASIIQGLSDNSLFKAEISRDVYTPFLDTSKVGPFLRTMSSVSGSVSKTSMAMYLYAKYRLSTLPAGFVRALVEAGVPLHIEYLESLVSGTTADFDFLVEKYPVRLQAYLAKLPNLFDVTSARWEYCIRSVDISVLLGWMNESKAVCRKIMESFLTPGFFATGVTWNFMFDIMGIVHKFGLTETGQGMTLVNCMVSKLNPIDDTSKLPRYMPRNTSDILKALATAMEMYGKLTPENGGRLLNVLYRSIDMGRGIRRHQLTFAFWVIETFPVTFDIHEFGRATFKYDTPPRITDWFRRLRTAFGANPDCHWTCSDEYTGKPTKDGWGNKANISPDVNSTFLLLLMKRGPGFDIMETPASLTPTSKYQLMKFFMIAAKSHIKSMTGNIRTPLISWFCKGDPESFNRWVAEMKYFEDEKKAAEEERERLRKLWAAAAAEAAAEP